MNRGWPGDYRAFLFRTTFLYHVLRKMRGMVTFSELSFRGDGEFHATG